MNNTTSPTNTTNETIVIRPADSVEDAVSLRLLAELDSSSAPAGPALIAEVDGETRAALWLNDGRVVADPFHPTADIAALLRVHAGNGNGHRSGSRVLTGLAEVFGPAERRLRHAFATR